MKFGVVQFPGSCDERDTVAACERLGEAVLLWHRDADLQGSDAIVIPGGFSYGDYLRVGAIARFSPVMESVIAFAREGGLVLGICNGFQVLCEAGLLPGALLPNISLRFVCRQVELEVVNADTPFTRSGTAGDRLSIPAKHTTGRYHAPGIAPEQIVLRYGPGQNPNGSQDDIAGVVNETGNVMGLMPHPEHAVDLLTGGSQDGLAIFESMALIDVETVALPTVDDAVALGLTRDEYALIASMLGREPNQVELAMFSLLWSEHCAYKHSKRLLATLPTEGARVFMGPGENAGAVDIGGGWAVAFKVESHNHPSAVEPFQGAATGVGGILRDIFAIGARPIAVLDALRFGEVSSARSRYLLDRAVAGIGHYGNSIGVPNVGGDVYFEAPYETSCLVNAMALGLARQDDIIRSAATGVGNVLVLFGASTGRDGIGGASVLASAELDSEDESKRPSVQVGDPFEESKLLECSLELLERGLLVALQDLGAAGLTSAAPEMASKAGLGIEIDVAKVPLREPGMEPFEIMVSESQERMLCVCVPENVDAVLALCEKWEVNGTAIGSVTDSGNVRIVDGGELLGDMPVVALVDDCPLYDLAPRRPPEQIYPAPTATLASGASVHETLLALLASPNIASRRPLFEQYDCLVQSRTARRPEQSDAAVLVMPPDADGAIATSIDCNGRRVAADPYQGAVAAVLECAANLACVGAEPLGTTNNLNFGNPEKPEIAWQMVEAVRGIADACRALDAPIVGGNVSLYNQGSDGPIYPTPVIGMVGLLPDAAQAAPSGFVREGDAFGFAGWNRAPSLAASELAKLRGEPLPTELAPIDIEHCAAVLEAVRDAVRSGDLRSCHDVAEGGWLTAMAEACLFGNVGATMEFPGAGHDWEILFGEDSCGFIVSGSREALLRLQAKIPTDIFGTVGGDRLVLGELSWTLAELRSAHGALAPLFA